MITFIDRDNNRKYTSSEFIARLDSIKTENRVLSYRVRRRNIVEIIEICPDSHSFDEWQEMCRRGKGLIWFSGYPDSRHTDAMCLVTQHSETYLRFDNVDALEQYFTEAYEVYKFIEAHPELW